MEVVSYSWWSLNPSSIRSLKAGGLKIQVVPKRGFGLV